MTSAFCAEVVGFFIYGGFFMLTSLGLIFLFGLIFSALTGALKLPKIIGMLITGIILGPYVLNLLSEPILEISGELRTMALVIILIKAGLSLNIGDLKKVGRPALLLSFVPAAFEICAYTLLAPYLLGVTKIQAALTGAVLSAVSPAVVVPRMVSLIENRAGTQKGIPQMLLAGASLDDVFVIVVFSVFLTAEQGGHVDYSSFADIPVSIITGIAAGGVCGVLLSALFEAFYRHGRLIKNSVKVIVVLGTAFLLLAAEDMLKGRIAVSGYLAVMAMSVIIAMRCENSVTLRLKAKFGRLWIAAEIVLFVLVGAAVDIRYTFKAGAGAVAMIAAALVFRSAGVLLCTLRTNLNAKERLFCVLSYLPKATVQAAIGAVPLGLGLSCGKTVLSVAVLGIIITAPLGAFAMDLGAPALLEKEEALPDTKSQS